MCLSNMKFNFETFSFLQKFCYNHRRGTVFDFNCLFPKRRFIFEYLFTAIVPIKILVITENIQSKISHRKAHFFEIFRYFFTLMLRKGDQGVQFKNRFYASFRLTVGGGGAFNSRFDKNYYFPHVRLLYSPWGQNVKNQK